MKVYLFLFLLLSCVYECSLVNIMPDLKQNILNFRYDVNFKYKGMLLHTLNRFNIETKFELPKIEDLHLMTIKLDSTCNYFSRGKVERIIQPTIFQIL